MPQMELLELPLLLVNDPIDLSTHSRQMKKAQTPQENAGTGTSQKSHR
jgi:hypothetical protein